MRADLFVGIDESDERASFFNQVARGLREIGQRPATVAQNEESCIVFGMPKEAIALGAADKIVPLSRIASEIVKLRTRSQS